MKLVFRNAGSMICSLWIISDGNVVPSARIEAPDCRVLPTHFSCELSESGQIVMFNGMRMKQMKDDPPNPLG